MRWPNSSAWGYLTLVWTVNAIAFYVQIVTGYSARQWSFLCLKPYQNNSEREMALYLLYQQYQLTWACLFHRHLKIAHNENSVAKNELDWREKRGGTRRFHAKSWKEMLWINENDKHEKLVFMAIWLLSPCCKE